VKAVYAKATVSVAMQGVPVQVREGTHWSDEDPIVKANPDLFSDDPRYGMLFSRPLQPEDYPPVEQATAAPGERRNTRRG
jgi:hypothetical protein